MKRRGVQIQGECPLCKQEEETPTHLRKCGVSKRVWFIIFGFNEGDKSIIDLKDWLLNIGLYFSNIKEQGNHLITNLMITLWAIWIHRNDVVFRKANPSLNAILDIIGESRKEFLEMERLGDLWRKDIRTGMCRRNAFGRG